MNVDKVGAIASMICAVHCALTGLALGLLSIVGLGFLGSPTAEVAFIGTALVLGTWAVVHGLKKHHSYLPALIFITGLVSLVLSHFVFGHNHGGTEPQPLAATITSVLGGLCFVSFHIVNFRLQKKCGCQVCQTSH